MRLRARLSLAAAAVLFLVLLVAKTLLPLVAPFLFALFFASLIDPVVTKLEKSGVPRSIGALMVIASGAFLVAGAAWIFIANLVREAEHFTAHLPDYAYRIELLADGWMAKIDRWIEGMPDPWGEAVVQGAHQVVGLVNTLTGQVLSKAKVIPGIAVMGLVSLTTTYFFCRDRRGFGEFFLSIMPRGWHAEMGRLKREVTGGLLGFAKAQLILIAISSVLSIVGLLLFGIHYAWLLGTLAGILDIVPMVGPSGVFLPVIAWFMIHAEWARVFGLLSVWLMILFIRQVLEPQIIGRNVGIHPVTSIASVYIGVALLGINGVFIGPIIAIAIKAVCVVSILPHIKAR